MGGSKGRGPGAARPPFKSRPLSFPQNEVHHADILTEVYSIASLGLQLVCQAVPLHLLAWPLHCSPPRSGIPRTLEPLLQHSNITDGNMHPGP